MPRGEENVSGDFLRNDMSKSLEIQHVPAMWGKVDPNLKILAIHPGDHADSPRSTPGLRKICPEHFSVTACPNHLKFSTYLQCRVKLKFCLNHADPPGGHADMPRGLENVSGDFLRNDMSKSLEIQYIPAIWGKVDPNLKIIAIHPRDHAHPPQSTPGLRKICPEIFSVTACPNHLKFSAYLPCRVKLKFGTFCRVKFKFFF